MRFRATLGLLAIAAVAISGCGGGSGAPPLTVDQAEQLVAQGMETLSGLVDGTSTDPAGDAQSALNDLTAALGTLPQDPAANFGWSLARAITLYFETAALFPARAGSAGLLPDPRETLRDMAGGFSEANASLARALVPPLPRLLSRQGSVPGAPAQVTTDITPEQVRVHIVVSILPAMNEIINRLDIAISAGTIDITLQVTINGEVKEYQVDRGDLLLLKGCFQVALATLESTTAHKLDYGAWNWDQPPVDSDSSGDFTPNEYLPPSPFLTLDRSTAFANARTAILAAADAVIEGADTSLHPGGETDLVNWNDPDVLAALNEAKVIANEIKTAFGTSSYAVEVDGVVVTVNISAWATAPPPDLKALLPTLLVDEVAGEVVVVEWPDLTFAGLFPDGLPPELLQGIGFPIP